MYSSILRVHFKKKKKKKKNKLGTFLMNGANAMFLFVFFFYDFLYKSICCGYSFELH